MGVYTSFFLASDNELAKAFRGWKRAPPLLDEPVTKTVVNPFTGKQMTVTVRVSDDQPLADPDVVEDGDSRHLPSLDFKGLMTTEILNLAGIIMGWSKVDADAEIHGRALCGPAESPVFVCELSPTLVHRLGSLSIHDCARLGQQWADRQKDEAATIPDPYLRKMETEEPPATWIGCLSKLSELSHRAVSQQRGMFMWICP